MASTENLIIALEAQLPQTQCGQCGFDGCAPYAKAIAHQEAQINLCPPGGERTLNALAKLLNTPVIGLADPIEAAKPKVIAWIDEDVCIGCVACIKACPVDAILGSTKLMHTVLSDECTGCGLCVAPCPVDCIHMQTVDDAYLPRSHTLAITQEEPFLAASSHAKKRFDQRNTRLERDKQERAQYLAARESQLNTPSATPNKAAFNPMDLLNKAAKKAEKMVDKAVAPSNQEKLVQEQIQAAIDQASIRQAMKDIEYGSETEKQVAIDFLRQKKREARAKKFKSNA